MIELLNLEKSFDDIKAVNRVSLNILDGEVFGLVGTNGAGKRCTSLPWQVKYPLMVAVPSAMNQ